MKKLASDLTLPSDLFLIIIISALAFFLGGLLGGLLLLVTAWPVAYLLEGAVGGLLLGLFVRQRYSLWLPVVAGMLSITLGLALDVLLTTVIHLPASVAMVIAGAVAGAIFSAILNARQAIVIFALVCAIGFGLGWVLLDTFEQNFSAFYDWIAQISSDKGEQVMKTGLMGLNHGFSFGLALALVVSLHRKEIET